MATTTTVARWTEAQSLLASGTAIDSGAETGASIDMDSNGYDLVNVQAKITFGASPDAASILNIYSSANSGTDVDSIPFNTFQIEHTASVTRIVSFVVQDTPYCTVKIKNSDSADTITAQLLYAGRKWENT